MKSFILDTDIKVRQTIAVIEIRKGAKLFKIEQEVLSSGTDPNLFKYQGPTQGVCTGDPIKQMQTTGAVKASSEFCIASDEALRVLSGVGFSDFVELVHDKSLFDVYDANIHGERNFVRVDWSAEIVYDLDRHPIPSAITFGYINGGMHDGNYDLVAATSVLNANPQITPIDHRGNLATTVNIVDIPYYNVTSERTKCISFRFSPTKEQMAEILKVSARIDKRNPTANIREAVIELDLLKLTSSGATLGKNS